MKIKATFFGKTLMVKAEPYNMREDETPDEILWVENACDMYALMTPKLRGKKVALVHRDDWFNVVNEQDKLQK